MTDDMFGDPGSTTGVDLDAHNGRLLLITPTEQEKDISTAFGPSDAVRADVASLGEGPHETEEFPDVLIFPRVLQSQLRSYIGTGKAALGRLGKGVAKPGQSAPWQLAPATDADKAVARTYMASGQALQSARRVDTTPAASGVPPF